MRNVNYVLLGAVIGASAFGVAQKVDIFGQPATAAISDTYRSLNLFGDVFEKVRTDYVEKPQDQKLVESAINGMLTSLD
ncbi:MAG TPA: peptidase S41, partial [Rhodoblastus sp.]|nr:peptidase S41 [Rhodoblastus sp.]